MVKHQLTQQDIDQMQQEIDYRKTVVRHEALEEVKETRAQGDLSENFEYHAAKKVKNRNESRIRFLERMVKNAEVIDESAEDEVGINRTVTLYLPEDDETDTYTLVSTMRQDSLKNLISVESPLGKALLGHHVGETVTVRVNEQYSYPARIEKIEETQIGEDAQIRSF